MKRLFSVTLLLLLFAPMVAAGVSSLCVECAPCCAADPCEACYTPNNDLADPALTFNPFEGIGEQVVAIGQVLHFVPTFTYHRSNHHVFVFSQVTDKTGHPSHAPPVA